jgi:N-acetylmuramoyl-L-alanine amidase
MSTDRDVQERLSALAFNPGPIDGEWGPKTREAVLSALWALDLLRAKYAGEAIPVVAGQPRAAREITEIVIHCTATPEGRDVTAADVRAWHKAQGWSDIGYHYLVRLDGMVEPGRPEAMVGAHVIGHNTGTLGVCYAGGVDAKFAPKDTRTPEQEDALEAVCRALIAKYPSIKKVSGHRDYAPKACPSFDVNTDPLGDLV